MKHLNRVGAALAALLLSACASIAPGGGAAPGAGPAPVAAVPAYDLRSKFAAPKPRKSAKVSRAEVNAEYQRDTEADEHGRPPSAAQIFRAHAQRRAIERATRGTASFEKAAGVEPAQWTALGPANVGGRVRALAFDPASPRRVLAGTASGGLWVSHDLGGSWSVNHDFLPNLSITTIVFDPNRRGAVYAGTGEESQLIVGAGVFRSLDNGATWQTLAATNPDSNPDWRFVNRLAMHPALPGVLLAGVTHDDGVKGAIYRSVDGGDSWVRVSQMKALDLAFDPNNPAHAVAGLDDGYMAYSRDAGLSWQRTEVLVPNPAGRGGSRGASARAEIAYARTQPGLVYASVDNEKGEVWRSENGGESWSKLATLGHLRAQGWYDNALWVDPLDAQHVITGGLDLHQSRDGGLTWVRVSDADRAPVSPHADHHAIVSPPDYGPSNRVILNGNDGGVYRAADATAIEAAGGGWASANQGLAATQFYSGAGRAAAGGRIIGGTQDNGSLALASSAWRQWFGGDGGFVAVDPVNDQRVFGSTQFLGVFRSDLGGGAARFICTGITEAWKAEDDFKPCGAGTTGETNFIAPMVLDPTNRNRMLAGAASLWVSDNITAAAPAWRAIKPRAAGRENWINAIAVHERDGNVVWVGHNAGEIFRTAEGLAPAPTWVRVGQGALPARRVNRILIDRDNAARVIVALTGFTAHNLWETTDGGATWRSITGNLPSAPIFDVKRHAANPAWLYAATSVGLFTSENGGASWSTTNEGPANVRIRELFWIDDATLGVATYGRGLFKVALAAGGHADYQDLWWSGPAENGWGMSITQHGGTIFAAMYVYDDSGRPVWYVLPGGSWNAARTAFSGALYHPSGSWFGAYDVGRFVVGGAVGSATLTFTGADTATLAYTINGRSGTKSIRRQLFGPVDHAPTAAYGDLWWGGTSQNGWGVAISQQYRKLFAVWYTYDSAGRTIWYVIPDGSWSAANIYTGTAYRASGSAWLGAAYDPGAFGVQPVGQVTFTFTDLNNGTMSYVIDGVAGTKPITRQPF